MRTRFISALAAPAVAALAFTASPAHAAGLTVSGSCDFEGCVKGHAGTTTLTDTSTGVALTCAGSDATATIPNGTPDGGSVGHVNSLTFTNCGGPFGLTFSVTTSGFPWPINADAPITGGISGTISGVQAHLTGTGCDATVAGSVPITLTNTTGTNATLAVQPSGTGLKIASVNATNNCFGLIHTGDVVQFGANYALTPNTIQFTDP